MANQKLTPEEIAARMKSAHVYPRVSTVVPSPNPTDPRPIVQPGSPGMSAYFFIIATSLQGTAGVVQTEWPATEGTIVRGVDKLDANEVATLCDNAIAIADTLFSKLALKLSTSAIEGAQ